MPGGTMKGHTAFLLRSILMHMDTITGLCRRATEEFGQSWLWELLNPHPVGPFGRIGALAFEAHLLGEAIAHLFDVDWNAGVDA